MYKHLLSPQLPPECPDNPTERTCGLVAANFLLESNYLTWDDDNLAHIDEFGAPTQEVLARKEDWQLGQVPARVDFGCLACGKCVRIQEEPFSEESVDIVKE